ncbi:MAG: hypothetical protein HY075_09625, partial [Deltaproteobacteria bacterium]|nr:hypothetical protein [Deltaproteobacteria bacterium]
MAQCTRCLLELSVRPLLPGDLCPNCGVAAVLEPVPAGVDGEPGKSYGAVAPIGPGAPMAMFSRFWQSVWDIIFTPAQFFSSHAPRIAGGESLSVALAFAVIVQWLASFFNFLWRVTVGTALESRLDDFFRVAGDVVQGAPGSTESLDQLRDRAIEFFFGAGAIVLAPFTTVIKLVLCSLLVHAAVRFFTKETADRPHAYSTTLKILAYASAPWVLCVIP